VRDFTWRGTGETRAPIITIKVGNATEKWDFASCFLNNPIQQLLRFHETPTKKLWNSCGRLCKRPMVHGIRADSIAIDMEFGNFCLCHAAKMTEIGVLRQSLM
jgi:hypothetical protein